MGVLMGVLNDAKKYTESTPITTKKIAETMFLDLKHPL